MGTNFYVTPKQCDNPCTHCKPERIHLGKSSVGWRFAFRGQPEWNTTNAMDNWLTLAKSGEITTEYGRQDTYTYAGLLEWIVAKAAKPSDTRSGSRCTHIGDHDFFWEDFS